MTHPLVVEAIETAFVPVCIFNNKKGRDLEILKRFKEPTWNNPVVRYLNAEESDIIPRKDGIWNTQSTVERMKLALSKTGKSAPNYLEQISLPNNLRTEKAEFAMHCYWEGEVLLGAIDGVYKTRSGWRDNLEVVEVTFAPEIVEFKSLVTKAKSLKCASAIFAHTDKQQKVAEELVGKNTVKKAKGPMRDAKPSDQKYYLTKTLYRHLPLTDLQTTKMNALSLIHI